MRKALSSLAIAVGLLLAFPMHALAEWLPGYHTPGFHGGQPFAAAEWNGGQVFGGSFAGATTLRSPGVVFWNGSSFSSLGDGLDPSDDTPNSVTGVQDLLVHEGMLVAAGAFSTSGGREVGCVARFENGEWHSLGAPLQGAVWDLESFEGGVVAIGPFTGAEDGVAGIAWFDGEAWQSLGERPSRASALAVHLGELYAGFHRWTGSEWQSLASTTGGDVTAMLSTPEGLVLAGEVYSIDGEDVYGILRWDGQNLEQLGQGSWLCDGEPGFYVYERPAACSDLLYHEGELYALAGFMASSCTFFLPYTGTQLIYGQGYAFALGRFDGTEWVEVGPARGLFPEDPDHRYGELAEWSRAPGALVARGEDILVAGDFGSVDGKLAAGVARLDAEENWHSLVDGRGRDRAPRALHLHEGAPHYWDARYEVSGLDAAVRRLGAPPDRLFGHVGTPTGEYFIGSYAVVGHLPPFLFPLVEAWSGERVNFAGVDYPWDLRNYDSRATFAAWWPGHGIVVAVEPVQAFLFEGESVGVDLLVIDPEANVLRASVRIPVNFEDSAWWQEDPMIGGLVVHEDHVVIALNGEVLRWNGSVPLDWDPNDPNYVPGMAGVERMGAARFDGDCRALLLAGDRLLVAGSFESYGKNALPYLSEWDGFEWVAPVWGSPNAPVRTLAATSSGDVWLGGDFTELGGVPTAHVAVWRGDLLGPLPDGPNGPVHEIVADADGIWVVGEFDQAGAQVAHRLARWTGDVTALALGDEDPADDEASPPLPARVEFLAPYPNPFNPQVELAFRLPRAQSVQLAIIDLAGRRVRTLLKGVHDAGTHRKVWDGTDDSGRSVASGSYFARLQSDDRVYARKLVLVR